MDGMDDKTYVISYTFIFYLNICILLVQILAEQQCIINKFNSMTKYFHLLKMSYSCDCFAFPSQFQFPCFSFFIFFDPFHFLYSLFLFFCYVLVTGIEIGCLPSFLAQPAKASGCNNNREQKFIQNDAIMRTHRTTSAISSGISYSKWKNRAITNRKGILCLHSMFIIATVFIYVIYHSYATSRIRAS